MSVGDGEKEALDVVETDSKQTKPSQISHVPDDKKENDDTNMTDVEDNELAADNGKKEEPENANSDENETENENNDNDDDDAVMNYASSVSGADIEYASDLDVNNDQDNKEDIAESPVIDPNEEKIEKKENNENNNNTNDSNTDTDKTGVNLEVALVTKQDGKGDEDDDAQNNGNISSSNTHMKIGEQRNVAVMEKEKVEYEAKREYVDIINPDEPKKEEKNEKKSWNDKSGNYVALGLVVSLFTFLLIGIIANGVNGVIDKNGQELGAIIGLTALNMFLTPILLWTVGYYGGIVSITRSTSIWVLLFWLLVLLTDFVFLAMALPSYSFFYIFYVVIKVILMYQFYTFGKIDVKDFGSGVIEMYVRNVNFLKNESKVLRLWPWVVCIIIIQMCLFILGCLAFVGNIKDMFVVKIILFFLLVWSIKVFTHFLHFIYGRMIMYAIDPKSRISKRTNSSLFLQKVTSLSTRMVSTRTIIDPQTNDSQTVVNAVATKSEKVTTSEDGAMGKIDASQETHGMASVRTQVTSNDGTLKPDLERAIQVTNAENNENNENNVDGSDGNQLHNASSEDNKENAENAENAGNPDNEDMGDNVDNPLPSDDVKTTSQVEHEAGRTVSVVSGDNGGGIVAATTEPKVDQVIVPVSQTRNVQESNELSTEVDLNKFYNDDNFDGVSLALSQSSRKVASLVTGSFFISLSGVPNMVANFSRATRLFAAAMTVCCAAADDAADSIDRSNRGFCCLFGACVGALLYYLAWLLEIIAKFLLKFCTKTILTAMALKNIDYIKALKKVFYLIKENQATFNTRFSSRTMLVLDNAISQHLTHLILLCSSFGAWCAIWMGYGEYAPLIHVSGYLAGRTAFELIEVLIQLWLAIWSLDPKLLPSSHPVYEILAIRFVEMEYVAQDGTKKTKEEIRIELEARWQVQKTTNENVIQTIGYEKEQHVLTIENETNTYQQSGPALIHNSNNNNNNNGATQVTQQQQPQIGYGNTSTMNPTQMQTQNVDLQLSNVR